MRVRRRVFGATVIVIVALSLGAGPAVAHANLLSSDPKDGATLATAPTHVTLTFSEPVDAGLSLVEVLDSSGGDIHAGPAVAVSGEPRELSMSLPAHLPDGVYTVNWRAVSAADSHITAKAFAFGVGVRPGATPTTVAPPSPPGPSVLWVAGKMLLYAGLAVLFAAAFVGAIAFGGVIPSRRALLLVASSAALTGAVVMLFAEVRDVGAGLWPLLRSQVGARYLWLLALVAGTWVASLWTGAGRDRWTLPVVGLTASGAMLARAVGGHASASLSASWLQIGAQWVHFMSVGAWIGGLVLVAVALRERSRAGEPAPVAEIRRFSTIAFWSVGLLTVTGSIRAVNELGGIAAIGRLLDTSYGITLTIKVSIAVVLVALGGINRYRSLPRLPEDHHLFRRVIGAELVASLTLFGFTAALTSLPPAASAPPSAPPPSSISARGSDFATTTKVTLRATPGTPGSNTFAADVTDYNTGDPAHATSVELQFQPKGSQQVGGSTLALRHAAGARWTAVGTNLSLVGTWSVVATVVRPAGTVQVPLTLTTRAPPQTISVSHGGAGQPDIYTIDLGAGVELQTYIDPGTAGPSQFHVTAFQDGRALPLASATLSATLAGGASRKLASDRLASEHFVANTTLSAGDWRFDIQATTTDGRTLQATFSQTIGAP
jgi:copper transport protein